MFEVSGEISKGITRRGNDQLHTSLRVHAKAAGVGHQLHGTAAAELAKKFPPVPKRLGVAELRFDRKPWLAIANDQEIDLLLLFVAKVSEIECPFATVSPEGYVL
jgi:hypothetical protein